MENKQLAFYAVVFTMVLLLFVFVFVAKNNTDGSSDSLYENSISENKLIGNKLMRDKLTGDATSSKSSSKFALPSSGFRSIPDTKVADQFAKIHIDMKDDFVYRKAYISVNSSQWTLVNLSSTSGKYYGVWVALNASGIVNISADKIQSGTSTNNYIAIYSCKRLRTKWDCHGGWQLRRITLTKPVEELPLPEEPEGPASPDDENNSSDNKSDNTNPTNPSVPGEVCIVNSTSACYDNDVYWYDSCGVKGAKKTDCNATQYCGNGICINNGVSCPQYAPPSPDWCKNGIRVDEIIDTNGCRGPPRCSLSVPASVKVTDVWASDYEANSVNYPNKTLDGVLSKDSRWSSFGDGQWIAYALNQTTNVSYIRIIFYSNDYRTYFDVQYSTDKSTWYNTSAIRATGLPAAQGTYQRFNFTPVSARYIRIVGHGRSDPTLWNSYVEVDINGFPASLGSEPSPNNPVIPGIVCEANEASACSDGDVYWYDSCNVRGTKRFDCNSTQNCTNGACVNNVVACSAVSNSVTCAGATCGNRTNNCGGTVNCGACNSLQNCTNNVCVNNVVACSAVSNSVTCAGATCGNKTNNCGGTVICGTCATTQTCTAGQCVNNAVNSSSRLLIVNHTAAMNFNNIPDRWITEAKKLTLHYAHTSHGSQITSGTGYIESYVNSKYNVDVKVSNTEGLPSDTTALRIYDGNPPATYINPEDYWASAAGIARTKAVADTGHYDFSMWSWCGQQSGNSVDTVNAYLAQMKNFETTYPDMRFILMTGHTDGSGLDNPSATLTRNNKMIRDYAVSNNMVLFDFADIEAYDPNGNYYSTASDGCVWCTGWCNSNPTQCQNLPNCAHSHGALCVQKGKAFWWMMARLAGWDGVST